MKNMMFSFLFLLLSLPAFGATSGITSATRISDQMCQSCNTTGACVNPSPFCVNGCCQYEQSCTTYPCEQQMCKTCQTGACVNPSPLCLNGCCEYQESCSYYPCNGDAR